MRAVFHALENPKAEDFRVDFSPWDCKELHTAARLTSGIVAQSMSNRRTCLGVGSGLVSSSLLVAELFAVPRTD